MLTLVKRIVTDIIFDLVLVARKFFGKTSDWLILVRMQIWHWFRIDSLAVNAQRRKLCGRTGRFYFRVYKERFRGKTLNSLKPGSMNQVN